MTPPELRAALTTIGVGGTGAGRLLGVRDSTVRKWLAGTRAIPEPAARLLCLAAAQPEARQFLVEMVDQNSS